MPENLNHSEMRLESIEKKIIMSIDNKITMFSPEFMSGGYVHNFDQGISEFSVFDTLSEDKVREVIANLSSSDLKNKYNVEDIDFQSLQPKSLLTSETYLYIPKKLQEYNSFLCANKYVSSTTMLYLELKSKKRLLKSNSSLLMEENVHVIGLNVSANLKRGNRSVNLMKSLCFSGDEKLSLNLSKEQLCKYVLGSYVNENSTLRDIKPGRYDCVFNPETAAYLFHEMLGHLLEADLIFNHPLLLEGKLKLGSKIANSCITFIDDPTLEGHSGHYCFDDEGIPAKKVELLTEGKVTDYLNNMETAHLLKTKPNGHARTIDYHFSPLVRMSTTYAKPGNSTAAEIISSIDKGIYIEDSVVAKNDLENFILLPKEIYLIEKGKITDQLAPLIICGNIFEFLRNIIAIGNDLKFYNSGCTKGYAGAWIPITTGGCSLYVKDVIIGGSVL